MVGCVHCFSYCLYAEVVTTIQEGRAVVIASYVG